MNHVVLGLEGCAVYFEDAISYSDSWNRHMNRVQSLFQCLMEARLTDFAQATVSYLGKEVGQCRVCRC